MALTITVVDRESSGRERATIADVNFGAGYTSGGTAFTAADFGLVALRSLHDVNSPQTAGAAGKIAEWDVTNGKLKLLQSAGAGNPFADVGTTDQSGSTRRVRAVGF